MKNRIYTINGTVLTPIHIGSGETYNIFDYHIKDGYLCKINYNNFLKSLTEKDQHRFNRLIDGIDRIELLKFRNEKFIIDDHSIYKLKANSEIISKYLKAFSNGFMANLNIESFTRLSDQTPYIPGSTIKGFFRTAFFDHIINNKENDQIVQSNKKSGPRLEKALIAGEPWPDRKTTFIDPFSLTKLEDAYFTKLKQKVLSLNTEYDAFLETIAPNSTFKFKVIIDQSKTNISRPDKTRFNFDNCYKKDNFIKKLFLFCKLFSKNLLINDHEIIKNGPIIKKITYVLNEIAQEPKQTLIKIGRFTGFDAKTFKEVHNVKTRGGYYQDGSKPRNRILTESKEPMGWVKLEITDTEKI